VLEQLCLGECLLRSLELLSEFDCQIFQACCFGGVQLALQVHHALINAIKHGHNFWAHNDLLRRSFLFNLVTFAVTSLLKLAFSFLQSIKQLNVFLLQSDEGVLDSRI